MADEVFKETVESLKEFRAIEHMQTITEYVEQVPILRIPALTCRGITEQLMREYNEKYFPPTEHGKEAAPSDKKPEAKK